MEVDSAAGSWTGSLGLTVYGRKSRGYMLSQCMWDV